jgi:hypothetical protein
LIITLDENFSAQRSEASLASAGNLTIPVRFTPQEVLPERRGVVVVVVIDQWADTRSQRRSPPAGPDVPPPEVGRAGGATRRLDPGPGPGVTSLPPGAPHGPARGLGVRAPRRPCSPPRSGAARRLTASARRARCFPTRPRPRDCGREPRESRKDDDGILLPDGARRTRRISSRGHLMVAQTASLPDVDALRQRQPCPSAARHENFGTELPSPMTTQDRVRLVRASPATEYAVEKQVRGRRAARRRTGSSNFGADVRANRFLTRADCYARQSTIIRARETNRGSKRTRSHARRQTRGAADPDAQGSRGQPRRCYWDHRHRGDCRVYAARSATSPRPPPRSSIASWAMPDGCFDSC